MIKSISRYIMAFFYIAAGVNHFWNPEFYVAIMPPFLPEPLLLVYLSGVAEVVLGALVLDPKARRFACWGIIAMLLSFYLVHGYMALFPGEYPGLSPIALYIRLLLQLLLIAWAWWHAKDGEPKTQAAM